MPIRKWDNLKVVTHNDMHIISVGSSFLGKVTEPYENLVRMLGTPRDDNTKCCLLYTSPSPRDATLSRMPSSA